MARSVLLNLLGNESSAVRALRNVGSEADRTADHVDRLDDSNRRASDGAERSEQSHGRLASLLGRLAPAAGQAAASIGMVAAGVGTAVPLVAGLSAALVAVAPAAAVAATGIAAIGLAGAALKIGMSGVGDAVKAALDPSDPEAYAAALAKLSPNARAFVQEIHALQPAFAGIKAAVQDRLFENLGASLRTTATAVLPTLKKGLVDAAGALNGMAFNALGAVRSLAKTGTLSTLFDGATKGLKNLTKVPGQFLTAFVQVGAAAAPVFQRMTKGLADGITKVAAKLSTAFSSGAMSGAIETAVGLLKQLAQVGKNVATIIGNIFGAAQVSGGGFIGTLQTITGMLAQVTANPAFVQGLQALFGVMANLAQTAAPLLGQALQVVAQVLTALAPAANVLIDALGAALQPVIAALGPVLVALAQAVGQLVIAFAPLLPVIGQLIAALLPVLVPVLQLVTTVLTALTPVIAVVAQALTTYLVPVITTVVGWVTQAITWFTNLASQVFPVLVAAVTGASGPLTNLGTALVNLWNAVRPLAEAIWDLVVRVFAAIAPALVPVGAALATAAAALTEGLAWAINNVVVPAINALTALLTGEATASIKSWADAVGEATTSIVEDIGSLAGKSEGGLTTWAARLTTIVGLATLRSVEGTKRMTVAIVQEIASWPGKMASAMAPAAPAMRASALAIGRAIVGGLKLMLPEAFLVFQKLKEAGPRILSGARAAMVQIGRGLIAGLIAGLLGSVGGLMSTIAGIGSKLKSAWKAATQVNSPSRMTMEIGEDVSLGLAIGIQRGAKNIWGAVSDVGTKLKKVWGEAGFWGTASGDIPIIDIGAKLRKALMGTSDQIGDAVKQIAAKIRAAFKAGDIGKGDRDGLLEMLAGSNTRLKKLSEERQKIIDKIKEANDYAKKITSEALSFASLTSIKVEGGGTPTGQQLVAGLQAKLATIRTFSANIKKLAQAGLSKSLLRQILDAGIDGGSAIAAELANGPNSIIAALNSAQVTIEKVAKDLGLNSADLLFDSGKNAGTGFLKGLKSMEKALTEAMNQIVMALLEALGIGIEKYKKKMDELAKMMYQTSLMQPKIPDGPLVPNPLKAPATPKPYLTTATPTAPKSNLSSATFNKNNTPIKTVNITMPVTVSSMNDADALASRLSFAARSATF